MPRHPSKVISDRFVGEFRKRWSDQNVGARILRTTPGEGSKTPPALWGLTALFLGRIFVAGTETVGLRNCLGIYKERRYTRIIRHRELRLDARELLPAYVTTGVRETSAEKEFPRTLKPNTRRHDK